MGPSYTGEEAFDVDALRQLLRRMCDRELIEYGRAAAFMASRSDRDGFRLQLIESRAEWKRRKQAGKD